eukprot:scaffold187676_cov26-Tisochrysis_lutea.AAC.8
MVAGSWLCADHICLGRLSEFQREVVTPKARPAASPRAPPSGGSVICSDDGARRSPAPLVCATEDAPLCPSCAMSSREPASTACCLCKCSSFARAFFASRSRASCICIATPPLGWCRGMLPPCGLVLPDPLPSLLSPTVDESTAGSESPES